MFHCQRDSGPLHNAIISIENHDAEFLSISDLDLIEDGIVAAEDLKGVSGSALVIENEVLENPIGLIQMDYSRRGRNDDFLLQVSSQCNRS